MIKDIKYKSNNNIVFSCKYHIVWCPKYRRKVLIDEVEIRLKEIIYQIAKELRVEIIEMETDRDPQFGVMNFVKKAKGRSSRLLRDEFHHLNKKLNGKSI